MTLSAELKRFLADHATVESWTAFANGIGTAPTAAILSAAMSAKGYQVGEADVIAALEIGKQSALADQQLDGVVGGQGTSTTSDLNLGDMFKLQFQMQVMSQYIEASSNTLSAVHTEMVSMAKSTKGQ